MLNPGWGKKCPFALDLNTKHYPFLYGGEAKPKVGVFGTAFFLSGKSGGDIVKRKYALEHNILEFVMFI